MKPTLARELIALGFGLAALHGAGPCFAQPSSPPPASPAQSAPPAEASERFQRGVAAFREGDFDAALAEFSRAYKLSPNYRLLYNLAQVQAERHDSVSALKLLGQYLAEAGDALDGERRANVARLIEELQRHVAEVRVSSNVSDALLAVDGTVVGRVPLSAPLWVNAGSHTLLLSKDGFTSSAKNVSIAGGLVESLSFELVPQAKAGALEARSRSLPPVQANGGMGGAFWTSIACAGAFAGAAVTFAVFTGIENRKLTTELDTYPANQEYVASERTRVKTFAVLGDAFGAAAIVATGAGIFFAIRGAEQPAHAATSAHRKQLRAQWTGTGIQLQGEL
jgi:tetratricopeptide (TPR) repeat protein